MAPGCRDLAAILAGANKTGADLCDGLGLGGSLRGPGELEESIHARLALEDFYVRVTVRVLRPNTTIRRRPSARGPGGGHWVKVVRPISEAISHGITRNLVMMIMMLDTGTGRGRY